jgi:predicted DCC family thiol-disulfide oxidoreductase YuxK
MNWQKGPEPREPFSYRSDPSVPSFSDDKPIVIFDGKCVMCSAFARFIIRHDHRRRFRLLAAQTSIGAALYTHFGLDPIAYETNILIEDGRAWFKMEGSIRIFEGLGFPFSLMGLARIVPRPLRDRLYDYIARNRLRWFGVRQTCYLPDPAERDRFIA